MKPNRQVSDAFAAGRAYERQQLEAKRAQSRAAQPKRKGNRRRAR